MCQMMILVVSVKNHSRLKDTKYHGLICKCLCLHTCVQVICMSVFCENIFADERTAIS